VTTIDQVIELAKEWQDAVRRDAVGMMSATDASYRGVMVARTKFVEALAHVRPAEVADALVNGRRAETRARELEQAYQDTGAGRLP
jgi:predicted DNA-binding protein (UPF0251 family)